MNIQGQNYNIILEETGVPIYIFLIFMQKGRNTIIKTNTLEFPK